MSDIKIIKTNSGGQPIFLDDIATIQESAISQTAALAFALFGGDDESLLGDDMSIAFLIRPVQKSSDGLYYKSGFVYYNGKILQYLGPTVPTSATELYINIRKEETTTRTMADGTSKACEEVWDAVLSSSASDDAVASYKVSEMECLMTRMKEYFEK